MAQGTFDITQTDAQLQAVLNKIQPLATTGDMAVLGFGYGVCSTAGATAAKTVSITNFVLTPSSVFAVNFENAFTASNPTLSVNGSAAKAIKLYGSAMPRMGFGSTMLSIVNLQLPEGDIEKIASGDIKRLLAWNEQGGHDMVTSVWNKPGTIANAFWERGWDFEAPETAPLPVYDMHGHTGTLNVI